MRDHEVVAAFVAFLAANGRPGLRIDRRPDEERPGDIDALAAELAIEHTSIDTLPDMRLDAARFVQIVDGIEKIPVPRHMQIVLPMHSIGPGQDWRAIRAALHGWLRTDGQHLKDGRHVVRIPGVPFEVRIFQVDALHVRPQAFAARSAVHDDTLSHRLRKQLDRKIEKLVRYKLEDKTTVLLVENDDIALMDLIKMVDAIRAAYQDGKPAGIDQVWYVSSAFQPTLQFLDVSAWTEDVGMPIMWEPTPEAA